MNELSNPALVPPGGLQGTARPDTTPPARSAGRAPQTAGPGEASFAHELQRADVEVRFSRHALERVQRRGIPLDQATLGRLSEGVGRAASKGSRDSLVLVDGTAFVVSVGSRTVITAVGGEHMKDNVFTNIDSAVIA